MKLQGHLAAAFLLSTLAACVVAPEQAPSQYPAPAAAPQYSPPQAYPAPPPVYYEQHEIARCQADNHRAHAEVLDLYNRAQARGRIDAAEAQYFTQLQVRLNYIIAQLNRGGLNLQECQYISSVLASDRQEVLRMSRRDPALAQCQNNNQRAHQDAVNLYEDARRRGRINPAEQQRFNAMQAQLQNLRTALARDGLSLQDCQIIGNQIAQNRDEIIRMSKHDPGVARCVADNRAAHDAVYALYNDGVRNGRINPGEAQRFAQMEKRLAAYQADARRDGLTLAECSKIGQAIARERAVVDGMIRRN
jgi:hypothetical protein